MADKTVSVKFEALTTGYEAGAKRMESATSKFAKATQSTLQESSRGWDGLAKSARENSAEWTRAGAAFTAFGAVSAAGLGVAGKAAIDWESAWTGVLKTVEGSDQQLGALNQGLRDMALELPASQAEIAGVAEAAGQLGIETDNIQAFTRTMIDLGETTNLSANDAATALARFANIMGTSQDEFSNIGSSVVELGNNFATTEREIVEMGLRLAGAGRQAGLTEGEVLGLATALSSVGIEAQAGGTAFSRVLIEMGVAVDTQGEKLATFAEVAGMSAAEFSRAWEEDAGSAIAAFVAGLGDMEASGQSIQPILEDLGMTDIRVGDALRRASSAADLFTGAMGMGNDAYAENIALSKEAELRYETVAAQLAMARNAATEAAISFGEVLMPAIAGAADAFADVAKWVADLPKPIQQAAVEISALAAGTGLFVGSALLAVPKLIEMYDALRKIQATAPLAAAGIGAVVGAASAIGTMVVLDKVVDWVDELSRNEANLEGLAQQLINVGDSADFASAQLELFTLGPIFGPFAEDTIAGADALDRFATSAKRAFNDDLIGMTTRWMDAIIPIGDGVVGTFIKDVEDLDAALAQMVQSGHSDEAAATFERFYATVADFPGIDREEIMQGFTRYEEAMKGAKVATEETLLAAQSWDEATFPDIAPKMTDNERATREAAEAAGVYSGEINHLQEQAEAAREAHDKLVDSLIGMVDAAFGAHRGAMDYQASLDSLTAAIAENGETHDIATEAGRANKAALLDLAEQARATAEANLINGESIFHVTKDMEGMRASFVEGAQQMGYTKAEANALADELGLTSGAVQDLAADIESVPSKEVDVNVRTENAKQSVSDIQTRINRLTGKVVQVSVITNYSTRGQMPANRRHSVALAGGGPIVGPGGPTQDLVPAFNQMTGQGYALSNGEHVMTAAEVAAAGGHGEVYRLRKALLAKAVRFDVGGSVGSSYVERQGALRAIQSSPSSVTAVLAPEDRELLRAVASRPVRADLSINNRQAGQLVAAGSPYAAVIPGGQR